MNNLIDIPNEFTVTVKFNEKSIREVLLYAALFAMALMVGWVLIQKLVKLL